jgi:hypothetical protein
MCMIPLRGRAGGTEGLDHVGDHTTAVRMTVEGRGTLGSDFLKAYSKPL